MSDTAARTKVNRRLTARQACQLMVRYRTGKSWHQATAMDLSPTGCRLRLGEELASGSPVAVLFETPLRDGSKSPSAEVKGTVTWCRPQALSYQVGVLFVEAPVDLQELLKALS